MPSSLYPLLVVTDAGPDERRSGRCIAPRTSIHFDIFPGRLLPRVILGHALTNQPVPCFAIAIDAQRLTNGAHERSARRFVKLESIRAHGSRSVRPNRIVQSAD